jgi:hypothetical protein
MAIGHRRALQGWPAGKGSYYSPNRAGQRYPRPKELDTDYGTPTGFCTAVSGMLYRREYTKVTVELDCATFQGKITPLKGDDTEAVRAAARSLIKPIPQLCNSSGGAHADVTADSVLSAPVSCNSGGIAWSIDRQPPAGCNPYPGGLFQQKLPNAGKGGPILHLAPDSDKIAKNSLLMGDLSGTQKPIYREDNHLAVTAGIADGTAAPFYYGRASDPIYKVTHCGHPDGESPGDPAHNPNNTFWHIPENASWSGGTSDEFFTVWDQTTNLILRAYNSLYAPRNSSHNYYSKFLGACNATTEEEACPMFELFYCTMSNYSDGAAAVGNGRMNGAGDSLGNSPSALDIRFKEWMSGEISHAIYLITMCEGNGTVFPAPTVRHNGLSYDYHALHCWQRPWAAGPRPQHGSLYFFDYTDAQIEVMKLPAWQKPMVVAMSRYGGYVGDTGGQKIDGTVPSRMEGAEAYYTAGIECPVFKWLAEQGVPTHIDSGATVYTGGWFANLGHHTGPNCPDKPCGVLEHVHIAHECVALGMAGLPGGCGHAD